MWCSIGTPPAARAFSSPTQTRSSERSLIARNATGETQRGHSTRTRLVLPSERAYLESLARRRQRQALLHRTARVVVPGILAVGAAATGVSWYWRHRQRQRTAEFEQFLKTALQDLGNSDEAEEDALRDSSQKNLFDSDVTDRKRPRDSETEAAAKRIDQRADLAGRLRLDVSMKSDVIMTDGSSYPPDSLEYRVDRFLSGAENNADTSESERAKALQRALQEEQWTLDKLVSVANGCIARVVSKAIEEMRRQAQAVVASDFGMKALVGISQRGSHLAEMLPKPDSETIPLVGAAERTPFSQRLIYAGRHRNRQDIQDLYRRYVIRTLVQEQPQAERELRPEDMKRLEETMQSLSLLEHILRIDEETARSIKDEAARFVFQMAVSATLADPNASVDETYLKELMKILENMLTPEIAEKIRSEVGMMRILYDIEKMVKEGTITAEDKRALRNLCTQLGFNVQDFLDSTAQLKEVLGAEGERYARLFQQIFGDDTGEESVSPVIETTDTKAVRVDKTEPTASPPEKDAS
ncbi:hypothetical protein CCYA_CCYA01G0190 [Cyanidiococcus yangmingshanensis]|nr:hypothetical protein CCYA_CCYA01G0190 [Cyanidiococcus yangmingshanensis]